MTSVPVATPLPLPAFQNGTGDYTRVPEHFLGHLRSVVSDVLSGGPSTRLCLGKKSDWVIFFVALSDSFMFLPLPEPKHSWSSWGQKIALIERTLEAVDRAFVLMDGIFLDPEHLLDKILTRLFDLCSVFEVWANDEVADATDPFTPRFMKDRTYKVYSGIVRRLGGSVAAKAAVNKPMWSYLQTFIEKCLQLVLGVCVPLYHPVGQLRSHMICRSRVSSTYDTYDDRNVRQTAYPRRSPSALYTFLAYKVFLNPM
jgi:hypothetical protein